MDSSALNISYDELQSTNHTESKVIIGIESGWTNINIRSLFFLVLRLKQGEEVH